MRKAAIFIVLCIVLSQAGCGANMDYYRKSALLMDTLVEIQLFLRPGSEKEELDDVISGAFGEIRRIEKIFSPHEPDSELSRVNRLAGVEPVEVSGEFIYLLKKAVEFNEATEGAFDISVAPLAELWRRASESDKIPGGQEITDALGGVGMEKIEADYRNRLVKIREGMRLDFGGIAKGYAVDKAMYFLKGQGIENAVINAGGDMYCLGGGRKGLGWRIGIRHPREKDACIATLLVKDRAVATSGDYERYSVIEGKKFSHIINPKTGLPSGDAPVSVTVMANDCLTADALATAVFVMGPDKGMELLDKTGDAEGVIISRNAGGFSVGKSGGLKELKLSHLE